MPNIEDDTWLETVDVHEEPCRYIDCTKVATHLAIMSKPCEHLWLFCLEHKDVTTARQERYAHDGSGEWQCPAGEAWHRVGLILRWECLR